MITAIYFFCTNTNTVSPCNSNDKKLINQFVFFQLWYKVIFCEKILLLKIPFLGQTITWESQWWQIMIDFLFISKYDWSFWTLPINRTDIIQESSTLSSCIFVRCSYDSFNHLNEPKRIEIQYQVHSPGLEISSYFLSARVKAKQKLKHKKTHSLLSIN